MLLGGNGFTGLFRCVAVLCLVVSAIYNPADMSAQDTRSSVTEPVIPSVRCAVLSAQLTADSTPEGISSANETTFDTSRIQSALTACTAGEAVELAPSGSYNAFLIQPITIPAGVTLLVDAGVTVYGSRYTASYQKGTSTNCGTENGSGSGCQPLILISSAPGAAIMGNGVIDGRGATTMLDGTYAGMTWWAMATAAHASSYSEVSPVLLNVSSSNNVTLYGTTFQNSPHFHITTSGSNNMIVWGIKINSPYDTQNTDGFDPGGYTNLTVENSYFNDGDDEIALTGGSSPVTQDTSIINNHFFDGHGVSIGSSTAYGVENMLVDNLVINSTPANTNATGLRIKSDSADGGLVENITYQNVCMKGVTSPIVMNAYYSSSTGTEIPQFRNITLQNVHATTEGKVTLVGYDTSSTNSISDLLGISLDNVYVDGIASSDVTSEYAQISLGPDPVNFASYLGGSGVSVTNSVTDSNSSYSCPSTVFNPIAGEIVHGPYQVTTSDNVTMQAQIINPREISQAAYITASASSSSATLQMPLATGTVSILEGTTTLGSVTLNTANQFGNINNVSIPIGMLTAGTHTLTGYYSGDINYSSLSFGSYTLLVTAGATTTTNVSTSTSAAIPGQNVTFTAQVSGSGGTPSGTVTIFDGSYPLGTVALSSGSATLSTTTLANITHTITANYNGDTSFATSTSSAVTVTVTKAASTVTFTASSPSAVSGYTYLTVVYGQPITFKAVVTPTSGSSVDAPSGNMAFKVGGKTPANITLDSTGTATWAGTYSSTSLKLASPNTTFGSYGGDTNFASSVSANLYINVIAGNTPTTTLTTSATSLNEGQSLSLTATVGTGNLLATDKVTFYDGTTALGTVTIADITTGLATLNLSSLTVGSHSITATYNGNITSSPSTSTATTVTVSLIGTSLTLTTNATSGRASPGQSLTLSAQLTSTTSGTASGTVTFYDGLNTLGTGTLSGNTATFITSGLSVSGHTLVATYASDGTYASSGSNTVYLVVSSSSSGIPVPPVLLPQTISTYAGTQGTSGSTGNGGLATAATFSASLQSLAVDGFGSLLVGDGTNKQVRAINPVSGFVTRFVGGGTVCTGKTDKVGDGCYSTQTSGSTPAGLATDNIGNLYMAGYGDNLVHKVAASTQIMTYVAGKVASTTVSGTAGVATDGTVATSATLSSPRGVWVDNLGNIYIADSVNDEVRVVYAGGTFANLPSPVVGDIYLLAGNATTTIANNVLATASGTNGIQSIYVDNQQNIYLADTTQLRVIYEGGTQAQQLIEAANTGVTPTAGYIYAVAGGGTGTPTTTPTLGSSVALTDVTKMYPDANGNLYLGDYGASAVYFFDTQTGYIRTIAGTPGTASFTGNGGAATSATLNGGSAALSVAIDQANNLYVGDSGNDIVRKVSSNLSFAATTVGYSSTQFPVVHFSAGDSPAASNAFTLLTGSSEFSVGSSPVCVSNADTTADCTISITFIPAMPGLRRVPLLVTAASGASSTYVLSGSGSGPALVMTTSTSATLGSNLTPQGVALDTAANFYAADAKSGSLWKFASGSTTSTALTTGLSNPYQVAADGFGNVYVADSGNNRVLKVSLSGVVSTVGSGLSAPRGVAVDSYGNVYIADTGNSRIVEVPVGNGTQLAVSSGFSTPIALSFDISNNLYVLDTGLELLAKIATGSTSFTAVNLGSITPTAFAVDAAGGIFAADQTSEEVLYYSSGSTSGTSLLTGTTSVGGLAFSNRGKLYVADSGATALQSLDLTTASMTFASSTVPLTLTLANAGNATLTFTSPGYSQSDSTDFSIASASSSGCNLASTLASANTCAVTATFSPQEDVLLSDTVTFLSNSASVVTVTFSGQAAATTSTTTSLSSPTPTAPSYGDTVSFTATVTAADNSIPTGYITFVVDSATSQKVTLNSTGSATTSFGGLTGGAHSITATYTPSDFCAVSSSTPVGFSIAQATPTLSWTPVSTLTYGTALSVIMSATASNSLTGTYVYTATSSSGTTTTLTSTSYLPVGSYTLGVTFTPTDSTDYTSATASASSLTITQATTTAGVGPTTNVVAADGTGNYTTLSSAISTLTSAGGTIYVKPGTYTGQNTISQANVALRGLGGDPTKVILTASNSILNSGSDKKSATLQATGKNFYMENISINNTYSIDNSVDGTQAIALYISGDKDVVYNSQFASRQDTLYADNGPSRQYFSSCKVSGTVDYIFGDAAAVFDNCVMYSLYRSGGGTDTVTAQNKQYASTSSHNYLSGYVITNSQFLSETNNGSRSNIYYGRPWGEYSTVIVSNNSVDSLNALGWTEMSTTVPYLPTAYYAEYGTTGSGAAGTRESYAVALTATQAAAYAPDSFLAGSDSWAPTSALNTYIAAVVPSVSTVTIPALSSVTLVSRIAPQSLGTPSGTATFLDGASILGSVTLDALGEASYTTSLLSAGKHSITVQYSGDTNFASSTSSATTVTVTALSTTSSLQVSTATPVYGNAVVATVSVTPLSGTGVPSGTAIFTLDSVAQTPIELDSLGEASMTLPALLTAGQHILTVSYSGSATYAASSSTGVTITVAQTTASVATVSSSSSAVMLQDAVTFTANVTSTAGTPTGSVTFLDGTTTMGTVQLSAGTAQLITSSLTAGAHSITVSYLGDTNFLPVSSSTIAESVVDFTIIANNSTLTVIPGKAGQFSFTLNPVSPATTMPAAITFTVSGLPAGATYTLTPSSLASGAASTAVTLNIQTALTTAAAKPGASGNLVSRLAPLSLALLLLTFVGRLRKAGRRFSRMLSVMLLLGACLAAVAGLNGCGSGGFLSQAQKSYTVTVTATSGTLSHSTNVTLTVE